MVTASYSATDHFYLLHRFMEDGRRRAEGRIRFKYSMKNFVEERFLKKLEEMTNFNDKDDSTYGDRFQKGLERTCVEELKTIVPSRGRGAVNYWWSDELSDLRRTTLKLNRKAQRSVAAGKNSTVLVIEYKEARRKWGRAIVRSKEKRWKKFCATLEQDPWGWPYGVVRAKITRGGSPESLIRGSVAGILDDLFVTHLERQIEDGCGARISRI